MIIQILAVALAAVAFAGRGLSVAIKRRWHGRPAWIMCRTLCNRDRIHRFAQTYARSRTTDARAFGQLSIANLTQRVNRVIRRRRSAALELRFLCLFALALVAMPVAAQRRQSGTAADEHRIAVCIHRSARGKPWLEKTLRGLRDQEGGWIGAAIPNRDGSHDLGPMQINSWWVPRIARLVGRPASHVRQWLRDDPCFNVEAARWMILTELAAGSGYWGAIGRFHSPTQWRQSRYTAAVARKMAGHLR